MRDHPEVMHFNRLIRRQRKTLLTGRKGQARGAGLLSQPLRSEGSRGGINSVVDITSCMQASRNPYSVLWVWADYQGGHVGFTGTWRLHKSSSNGISSSHQYTSLHAGQWKPVQRAVGVGNLPGRARGIPVCCAGVPAPQVPQPQARRPAGGRPCRCTASAR